MMRRIVTFICLMLGTATVVFGCSSDDAVADGNASWRPDTTQAPAYSPTPEAYRSAASHAGEIQTISYTTHDADGTAHEKQARVYLPYGYDSAERYDILYLMHGYGGGIRTIFEGTTNGRTLKFVIDHLIEDGFIRPLIVVTPTMTSQSDLDSWEWFATELREDLIPAVECRYSTYAESTSEESLIASRDHRAFGGFSMGATTTWGVFTNDLAYFRFFMPISGTCWHYGREAGESVADETAEYLRDRIIQQGYRRNDFYIMAATGTQDVAYPLRSHIEAMEKMTDMFTYDYHINEGNLYFMLCNGGRHNYDYVTDYFFDLLPYVFPANSGTTSISKLQASTSIDAKSVRYFDIQGRSVYPSATGLLIRQTVCEDGSYKVAKVLTR